MGPFTAAFEAKVPRELKQCPSNYSSPDHCSQFAIFSFAQFKPGSLPGLFAVIRGRTATSLFPMPANFRLLNPENR